MARIRPADDTPAFPDGITMWQTEGQWRAPEGTIVREPSYVVELLHTTRPDFEERIRHVIDDYERRFEQQSALRTVVDVRENFR